MSGARGLYSALFVAALPLILLRLLWRSHKLPAYRQQLGERFGFHPASPAESVRPIWIHAVSVGETRAAQPLVEALLRSRPGLPILVTYMTPTGRATGLRLLGDRVRHAYLPYDYPAAVRRFIAHFNPRLGLVMETEVWPNLLAACARNGTPVGLVNARMSEKSARGYRRVAALVREALGSLAFVTAQSASDCARLVDLGAARVSVAGNIKFDMTPDQQVAALGRGWRADMPEGRRVLLAASTREGEEVMLLEAWKSAPPARRATCLLVVVPRHPQRFAEVASLIESSGFRFARRSLQAPPAPDLDVWLGDSMGEMAAYYAMCDLAFVGGSLLPFGGHNLIEPLSLGRPVLIGPHTYNFAAVTEAAIESGSVERVRSAGDLVRAAFRDLYDAPALAEHSRRALAFVAAHRGAVDRNLVQIDNILDGA